MNDQACWCIVALTATVAGFGVLILRSLNDLANLVDGTPGWSQVDQIARMMRAYGDSHPKFSVTTTTTKPAKAGKGRKKA